MKKINQRVKITKMLIHNALIELLSHKKIDKINATELCSEAGINRATFYSHYNTPFDVLNEISEEMALQLNQKMKPPTLDNVQTNLEILTEYIYENSGFIKIIIDNNSDSYFVDVISNMNKALNTLDESSAFDEDSIKLISGFLAGGGYHMIRMWLDEDIKKTPKEIAQLIYDLFRII